MKQSWQDKMAHDLAQDWLRKCDPARKKRKPSTKSVKKRQQRVERRKLRRLKQMQDRQILARPLLKGVE